MPLDFSGDDAFSFSGQRGGDANDLMKTPLLALVLLTSKLSAGDWSHWRGETRDDVSTEDSGFDSGAWPPAEAWQASVGNGSSSPLVVGGKLFTIGHSDGQDSVVCLDASTGAEIWRQNYKSPEYGRHSIGDKNFYRGPSATPEFDAASGMLFTLSIDGELNCWDTGSEGRRVWGVNLYDRYQIPQRPQVTKRGGSHRDYGYSCAPLVFRDWVIVEAGDPQRGNLLALDKMTGKEVWWSENRDPAGHSGGIVPMVVEGIPCLAVLTARNLVVARIDPRREGEIVAEYPWATDFINNIPTPTAVGNQVVVTSRYNISAMAKLEIKLQGGAHRVWQIEESSGVCSPVVHGDHLYWAGEGMHCVELATGKLRWSGGKYSAAGSCIATADGRILVWANDGDLSLVETYGRSPQGLKVLAEQKAVLRDMAWPHVVLAGGRIFCRDRGGRIKCLALTEAARKAIAAAPEPASPTTVPAKFDLAEFPGDASAMLLAWKSGGGKRRLSGALTRSSRYALGTKGAAEIDAGGSLLPSGGGFTLIGDHQLLRDAFAATGELTLEILFDTADLRQGGPARILTFSESPFSRNFTLGQEEDKLVLRLRTTETGENGMRPETVLAPIVANRNYHCLVTYHSGKGELACYLNGAEVYRASGHVSGGFSNWTTQQLLLGDEAGDDTRPWLGRIDGFALFDRAMDPATAGRRFRQIAR